ncbi:MAG: imidazole glycerol phosphate synthase subunit HisH [Elusimicrobiota bacterium]
MIALIDYGMGNLNSVSKALDLAVSNIGSSQEIKITSANKDILNADAVVLPGVGAFGQAIENLKNLRLINSITEAYNSQKPFLGVCLGLQLLFEKSYEHGMHKGLGLIKGEVRKFELPSKYKIPHMGWNLVSPSTKNALFAGIPADSYFYFVHSYYVQTNDKTINKMLTKYGKNFCSGVYNDFLCAVQFHPEKSQSSGIKLLENFCKRIKSRSQK